MAVVCGSNIGVDGSACDVHNKYFICSNILSILLYVIIVNV